MYKPPLSSLVSFSMTLNVAMFGVGQPSLLQEL
jgi:hypothetical protein